MAYSHVIEEVLMLDGHLGPTVKPVGNGSASVQSSYHTYIIDRPKAVSPDFRTKVILKPFRLRATSAPHDVPSWCCCVRAGHKRAVADEIFDIVEVDHACTIRE